MRHKRIGGLPTKKQRAKEQAKTIALITEYLFLKWEEILHNTNLTLVHGKKGWWVENDKFKVVKKGTFHQCVDFILNQYIKAKSIK